MPFLVINGITFPVARRSATAPKRDIGDTSEADNGDLRRSRQAIKKDWKGESTLLAPATAHAWAQLLEGEGEVWNFDASLYGSKGTGPTSFTGCSVSATQKKFGAKALAVAVGGGFVTPVETTWAVGFWLYSGGWSHYFACSDGRGWRDGAAHVDWYTYIAGLIAAGSLTLPPAGGVTTYYDDLVVLPFVVPSTWPPVWGVATSAFSQLDNLNVTGDAILEGGTRVMKGIVGEPKYQRAAVGGVSSPANQVLPVTLEAA